jgi:3-oxoacyl-[acyl-carrier protein] reductase
MPEKTILVCGANSALAKGLLTKILKNKSYTTIITQSRCTLEHLKCELKVVDNEIIHLQSDVSCPDEVDVLCQKLTELVSIDHIVYFPAPPVAPTPFRKLSPQDFQIHMQVQVFALQRILSTCLPSMSNRKHGKIIAISSEYIIGTPPSGLSHYVVAKQAQWALLKALAVEYAAKKIQFNAIAPSMVDTPYIADLPNVLLETIAKGHPMGRLAMVEDIIPSLEFLLSSKGDYINGVLLPVTGKG